MSRRERRAAAKGQQAAYGSTNFSTVAALYKSGRDHLAASRYLEAQLCCRQILDIDPNHADTLHLMGILSNHLGQYDHALEWFSRAIRRTPKPEYLASLGIALQRQGHYEEALKALDKAIQFQRNNADYWRHYGDIFVQLLRFDEALLSFRQVLNLDPNHQDALYKAGAVLHKLGRNEEAITYLERSEKLAPDHAPTIRTRAWILFNLKRFEESVSEGRRAHQLDPNDAETCNNLGLSLRRLGRHDEALRWFDKAIERQPRFVEAFDNRLLSLYHLHRFGDVFALYDRMKVGGLDSALTEWNVALAHLLTGDFEAGWRGHHARLKLPTAKYPQIPRPMWLGEAGLEGKTVLVAADEGLGDTIQFVRYVSMLAKRCARVLLVVQDPLHRLMSNLAGISHCAPMSAVSTLPAFDLHCPISSLPLAFGTRLETIPSEVPYLPPPKSSLIQAWEMRLGPRTKPRVGLVWSGDPAHANDHNRSIPLRTFSRILDVDATFVSLQKALRPNDAAVLRERSDIVDLTNNLTDFAETAALVNCLDLVITVDTSVAHLAGALGRPTWILLPYTPDYRWLLHRDDSPWYPSARLFRQPSTGAYEMVIQNVRAELIKSLAASGRS